MNLQEWSRFFYNLISSKKFFYFTVGLLVFQALWLALSGNYPMAFDEHFHFGFIQVYAGQWGPFITEAPEGTGALGPLTREPSYLFAYLMSFPYRLIAWLIPNIDWQIILLRFINIGFFTAGLFAFYTLLRKTGASRALVHFALFMFVLIPAVPFLAAHINYDNLLFLLVPIILLVTLTCADRLRQGIFPVYHVLMLAALCLITSVVKYPFLPIAAGIVLYLIGIMVWKRSKAENIATLKTIPVEFMKLSFIVKLSLLLLVVISGALFIERYGVNYVQYGALVPDCGKVLGFEHCSEYGPWIRNYWLEQNAPEHVDPNILYYGVNWFYDMSFRLFFAINSDYTTRLPLALPFITALLVAVGGIILTIIHAKRLMIQHPVLILFASVTVVYTAVLFFRGFGSYLETGEFLALNGRYFIPLLPLILITVGLAFREQCMRKKATAWKWKFGIAVVAIIFFLQGGGLLTYILRSDASWHRQDPVVISTNETAKQLLSPIVLGERIPLPFSN